MQVNVKNVFDNIFRTTIFKKLCDVGGPLASIVPFIRLVSGVHCSIYYQHG
jgi:hypothetical protein